MCISTYMHTVCQYAHLRMYMYMQPARWMGLVWKGGPLGGAREHSGGLYI